MFTAETPIVKEQCFISNFIKVEILSLVQSRACPKRRFFSAATIQKIINELVKYYQPYYQSMPKNLQIDEFMYGERQMAFEYINIVTGTILDILPSKDTQTIKDYFLSRHIQKQREKVKTITIDMNDSYGSILLKKIGKSHRKIILCIINLINM
ncbi:transposase [Marinilactibacillus kalidii]|uniref:transposase n=1 Tax=Marinilactibacillus kalidii TaxID=2820274 RepID=UPI001ABE8C38|nr:transposase [Marinilactibacillus kalidii]